MALLKTITLLILGQLYNIILNYLKMKISKILTTYIVKNHKHKPRRQLSC
jgi:uncharacterized membrane protein